MLQASWKRKDVKRRNGDMIELRKQRVSLDVRGIVFAVFVRGIVFVKRKSCLPLEEINFGVTVSFVCLVVLGRGVRVSINVAQR